jgi:hypothetical protein
VTHPTYSHALRWLPVLVCALLILAPPSHALEKTTARISDAIHDSWDGAATCTVSYYNVCTGWIWVWDLWQDSDRFGVCFTRCCPAGHGSAQLQTVSVYVYDGTIPGYGYTATLDVWPADENECPVGLPIATQPFQVTSGWLTHSIGVEIPSSFVVTLTLGTNVPCTQAYATDHPAFGPTGPQPCGTCFASTRMAHSYYYGTPTSPLCPGEPFNDHVCDAELIWAAGLSCEIDIDETSWSHVKALYR